MKRAFSYIRFSSAEQRKGDSYRRQMEKARAYAEQHDLLLDESLSFQDLGKSAFRGTHAEVGKLGEFLQAIEEGLVAEGDYLLIESLDRLSRQKIDYAYDLLRSICRLGIHVVTFSDGKIYTKESLNDPISMLTAIILFMRSNEESETKSKRVGDAWANKRKNIANKPLTAKVPGWIRYDKEAGKLCLIEDRTKIVMQIFDDYLKGISQQGIATKLNNAEVPTWGVGRQKGEQWHRSYIEKILRNRAVTGTFIPHVFDFSTGKRKRVPCTHIDDYYPQVIDEETFHRVQALRSGKNKIKGRKSTQPLQNIFSAVAVCPYCGMKMVRVNKGKSWTYLVCGAAKYGATVAPGFKFCQGGYKSYRYGEIEEAFIDAVKDGSFDIPVAGVEMLKAQKKIAELENGKGEVEAQKSNLITAIIQGTLKGESVYIPDLPRNDGTTSDFTIKEQIEMFEDRVKFFEKKIQELKNRIEVLQPSVLGRKMQLLRDAVAGPVNVEQANAALRALCSRIIVERERLTVEFLYNDKTLVLPYGQEINT